VATVAYQLGDRPAALLIDVAAGTAEWRVDDQVAPVSTVLAIAPAGEVEALVRRAIAEVRAHAAAAEAPRSEVLRRLAAEIWRDYRFAADGGGEQQAIPGV
jgi:hypothetical protein